MKNALDRIADILERMIENKTEDVYYDREQTIIPEFVNVEGDVIPYKSIRNINIETITNIEGKRILSIGVFAPCTETGFIAVEIPIELVHDIPTSILSEFLSETLNNWKQDYHCFISEIVLRKAHIYYYNKVMELGFPTIDFLCCKNLTLENLIEENWNALRYTDTITFDENTRETKIELKHGDVEGRVMEEAVEQFKITWQIFEDLSRYVKEISK